MTTDSNAATSLPRRLARPLLRSSQQTNGTGTRRLRHQRREELAAYLFLAPALIAFLLFMLLPMALTFALSFFNWTGISWGSLKFTGLSNYSNMVQDGVFWQALRNNLIFIVLGTAAVVITGLLVATLLEQNFRGSNFFRGVFFLPTVLSTVVVGIVFGFLLSPQFGIMTPVLSWLGVDASPDPLSSPTYALYTMIGIETWRSFGFAMFLFVAGLKALNHELTEAARIDGANGWQTFWHVTLPQLRPVTLMVSTLVGIGMLKLFDLIYVMTQGGPSHATEVLNTFSYDQAFNYNSLGYGASIAVVLLVITFGLTVIRFKVLPDERRDAAARA
jgi:ABC-type sugar transport system permease subunit